ncbi:MAG: ATP-binding cassette domain-containing protein [Firmicutes bacterium]|nr:ATP-binding cassette domain-containing protein [Bacillota bacterium]
MVTASGLSKIFSDRKRGQVVALEEVSFEARPGEVFGILGVNGAGKTTLLRVLGTILAPSAGDATVAGYNVRTQPQEVRQHIGYLTGSTALYGRLTAREILHYFGTLYGLSREHLCRRVDELVETLRMQDFIDGRCDRLSTGQQQRVSIARSILHNPPVMFMDEPTAGLDVVTSRTIMQFIDDSRRRGHTILFSTHIMSEAERLCDRIAVIHRGRIVAIGTLDELRTRTGERALELVFLSLIGEKEDPA